MISSQRNPPKPKASSTWEVIQCQAQQIQETGNTWHMVQIKHRRAAKKHQVNAKQLCCIWQKKSQMIALLMIKNAETNISRASWNCVLALGLGKATCSSPLLTCRRHQQYNPSPIRDGPKPQATGWPPLPCSPPAGAYISAERSKPPSGGD